MEAWLLRLAGWLLPPDQRGWAQAMRAELEHAGEDRLAWAAGCALAAVRLRTEREAAFAAAVLIALVALVWLDWNHGDLPAVAVLLAAPLALAWMVPARAWQAGVAIGACPLVTHGLADVTGLFRPAYQYMALMPLEWLTLAAVALPAVLMAMAGARLRTALA